MKTKLIILTLLVLCALVGIGSAQNMSISDMGFAGPQTVQIYENGILLGTWNTSTNGIPLPVNDFTFVIKPELKNQLNDPALFLGSVFDFLKTNVIPIMVIIFLIGLFWLGRRN